MAAIDSRSARIPISCPWCAKIVPATAVSLQRMVGKCDPCDGVFDLGEQLARPLANRSLPIPPGWSVERSADRSDGGAYRTDARPRPSDVRITWRPRGRVAVVVSVALVGAPLALVLIASIAARVELRELAGLAACVALTIALGTWVLSARTEVLLSGGRIVVRQWPLRRWRETSVYAAAVRQVYVAHTTRGGGPVLCVDRDGARVDLVDLERTDDARYLEHVSERWLAQQRRDRKGGARA